MTDLTPLYREMAAGGDQFRGLSLLQHRDQLKKLMRQYSVKRVLDYGCGAGDAYRNQHKIHRDWGLRWFDVTLYDPAFSAHDEKPHGKFDAVLCSDVLEHIPEDAVDEFVKTLYSHVKPGGFLWASVCCRPAKKTFPGTDTNLHVTIQPMQWWLDTFDRHAVTGVTIYLVETP